MMDPNNQTPDTKRGKLHFDSRKKDFYEEQLVASPSLEDTFGITTISSMDSLDNDLFYDEEHIAQLIDSYLKLHYPHLFETEETKDVATQWYETECRYQEFIQFYKQYEFDRKRVSYD